MEIKTCEQYVLNELEKAQEELALKEKSLKDLLNNYGELLVKYGESLKTLLQFKDSLCLEKQQDDDQIWVRGFFVDKEDPLWNLLMEWISTKDNPVATENEE